MNLYESTKAALEAMKCPTCQGHGECDDAEPGDISFRTWQCTACGGTGIKREKADCGYCGQTLIPVMQCINCGGQHDMRTGQEYRGPDNH